MPLASFSPPSIEPRAVSVFFARPFREDDGGGVDLGACLKTSSKDGRTRLGGGRALMLDGRREEAALRDSAAETVEGDVF
jgi:hypothetical protein